MNNPNLILDLENPQSKEEDEEIEEQRRRQEELADLLADGIHAFTYDESTINSTSSSFEAAPERNIPEPSEKLSSNFLNFKYDDTTTTTTNTKTSISLDNVVQNYRDISPEDQLKVLYDVRVREINNLKEEFAQYKTDKCQEISNLKTKLTLSEAEIRHLQLSVKNLEGIVVEKTETIQNLGKIIKEKDLQVEKLIKNIEQMKMELISYTTTIEELQLQLANTNPFTSTPKNPQVNELNKVHQEQIGKLEKMLQEQMKKSQRLEHDKKQVEEELKKLIESKQALDEENNLTIQELSKKLQAVQQDCKNLYVLGEAIKEESDHFKERLNQVDNNMDLNNSLLMDSLKNKLFDKETILLNQEKMRRLLLDKDKELGVLQAKLKFYTSDIDELFHYREMLQNANQSEIKQCNNPEHFEQLVFTQRQLQSYQQAVEDRNAQITNLNLVNKELQERIEEMIQQTRAEIQNLSQKYSLPQLEIMSNELKNAHALIDELKTELEDKSSQIKSLKDREQQLIEENKQIDKKLNNLARNSQSETDEINELKNMKIILENELRQIKEQLRLEIEEKEMQLKKLTNELVESKNYSQIIEAAKIELESQYDLCQKQLNEAKNEIIKLQKNVGDIQENSVRRSLYKELVEAEQNLSIHSSDNKNKIFDSEMFKQCLQVETLKIELQLRDEIRSESAADIEKIQNHYQTVLKERIDEYKMEKKRWQKQELAYKNHFAAILEDCSKKMGQLEQTNFKLTKDLQNIVNEYQNYKKDVSEYLIKCSTLLKNAKSHEQSVARKWESLLQFSNENHTAIEKGTVKNLKKVVSRIKSNNTEMAAIEANYEKQKRKLQAHFKNRLN